jgi:glutathione S-transferase
MINLSILFMPKSSDETLKYVDAIASEELKLYPANSEHRQQIEDLVDLFDAVLAPAVRLWTYFYILNQAHLVQPLWCQGIPWFERLLFPVLSRWIRSNRALARIKDRLNRELQCL